MQSKACPLVRLALRLSGRLSRGPGYSCPWWFQAVLTSALPNQPHLQWWLPPSASTASGLAAPSCPPSPPSSRWVLRWRCGGGWVGRLGDPFHQCTEGLSHSAQLQDALAMLCAPLPVQPAFLPALTWVHPVPKHRRCGSARASTTRAAPPSCTASASKRAARRRRPAPRSRRAGSRRVGRHRSRPVPVPPPFPSSVRVPAPRCLCHSR